MFDIIISNGIIIDGSGNKSYKSDIAIVNGKISKIDTKIDSPTKKVIDAKNAFISPGFIDIHTHSDISLYIDSRGLSKVKQGVTTDVTGNCGYSPFPLNKKARKDHQSNLNPIYGEEIDWDWSDLDEYRECLEKNGLGLNIAPLVGHSAVRGTVMGFEDRSASKDDLRQMRYLLEESMEQGAFGFSTGLTLPPSAYADTEEIVQLTSVLKQFDSRFYTSHIRAWAGFHKSGVEEAVNIGIKCQVPVQVSHMAINDPKHWGEANQVIKICENAVANGFDVSFDVYPYTASSSGFSQCFPFWSQSGGLDHLVKRLKDSTIRKQIKTDMLDEGLFRGWPWMWDKLVVASVNNSDLQDFEGMNFEEIGDKLKLSPIDAALELMFLDNARLRILFFYRTEHDMKCFLTHPLGMLGSDGLAIVSDGILGKGKPHPRSYGAHTRVLEKYVRDEKLLSLENAIYKMSGQISSRLGLKDRGLIKKNYWADICVFKLDNIHENATYEDPHQYSEGIDFVIVNGELILDHGIPTGALSGKVLNA